MAGKIADLKNVTEWTVMAHCESTSPLLMDRYDEAQMLKDLVFKNRDQPDTTTPVPERCPPKLYRAEDGRIALPTLNFRAALAYAGRSVKFDARKSLTASNGSTMIDAFIKVEGMWLYILNGEGKQATEADFKVDVRKAGLHKGATTTAVAAIRPRFDKWSFDCEFSISTVDGISMEKMKYLVQMAGVRAGLGSFRPNKGGPFGCYKVTEWVAEPMFVEEAEAA